jgi:hypothetical protein
MAWTDDEKMRILEAAAVYQISRSVVNRLLSGRVTKAENQLLKVILGHAARGVARVPGTAAGLAVRGAGAARFLAMRHPAVTGAAILYAGYHERERIADLLNQGYEFVSEGGAVGPPTTIERFRPGPAMVYTDPVKIKRAISKANKAVKEGMKMLKRGTKRRTGSRPGTLPKDAFKTVVKAAGLANPLTRSKIGKGKSKINKLARQLKKWW